MAGPWAALVVPATLDKRAVERVQQCARELGPSSRATFVRPWPQPWGYAWGALFVTPALSDAVLEHLLELLVELNLDYLRANPATPSIYDAGVHYRAESPFQEEWLTIPWALARSRAGQALDCEDLCAWRCAELRFGGERAARCVWSWQRLPNHQDLVHVRVRRADGSIEDPSALRGMGHAHPTYGGPSP